MGYLIQTVPLKNGPTRPLMPLKVCNKTKQSVLKDPDVLKFQDNEL